MSHASGVFTGITMLPGLLSVVVRTFQPPRVLVNLGCDCTSTSRGSRGNVRDGERSGPRLNHLVHDEAKDSVGTGIMQRSKPSESPAPWSRVWALYAQHADVFRRVLAKLRVSDARFGDGAASELVHEFLTERAPGALSTFDPSKGEMGAWLFIVFERFVLERYRRQRRRDDLLDALTVRTPSPSEEIERTIDLHVVSQMIASLSSLHEKAIQAFFSKRTPSVRAVATTLGVTRRRAAELIAEAAAVVAVELGAPVDMSLDELRRLAARADAPGGNEPNNRERTARGGTDEPTRQAVRHLVRRLTEAR